MFTRVEALLQKHDLGFTNYVQILLYGYPLMNVSENGLILLATLEFIIKTKRFEELYWNLYLVVSLFFLD